MPGGTVRRADIRNVAIIAHVDHGKTTLVDGLLKQSNVFRDPTAAGTLIMDSNALERERGITILAKNTAVTYAGVTINIIDTPGHADFGGEVERVLNMADGCLVLVDAVEGPMPQTRYVLGKALALNLRPIVVVNKVDRAAARPAEVVSLTQDLFLELATDEAQLDFPILYAIARDGRAGPAPDALAPDLRPLFDAILEHIPGPIDGRGGPFQMLVAALDYDNHRGRLAIGRVSRGTARLGSSITRIGLDGVATPEKVTWLATYQGLKRVETPEATAGDIVVLAGMPSVTISDTLADPAAPEALPGIAVEEPTLRLTFGVNSSPFAGRDGQYVTSRQLKARLLRELETNVSLRVADTEQADVFEVAGRGELHLSILIEMMRREGYEFQVSRPEVITRRVDGVLSEPMEHLYVDTDESLIGVVSDLLGPRRARLVNMAPNGPGKVRVEYTIPTRGLIGFRNAFLTATRGNGVMASLFTGYEPWQGPIDRTRTGALLSSEAGSAVTYGLAAAQQRGVTFVDPGTDVYEGMIVGQNSRDDDLAINVCREKQKTNIRSSTADIAVRLSPTVRLSLEQSLDFLADDELLEVTPKHLRLRKRFLSAEVRARARKQATLARQ
ncbi:MAG: translational GTPase TypA [Chloroflexi bacterium]|nr:translational GTPase TypA [Chloroflexota bacterium]